MDIGSLHALDIRGCNVRNHAVLWLTGIQIELDLSKGP
jgi:hypothetical protein